MAVNDVKIISGEILKYFQFGNTTPPTFLTTSNATSFAIAKTSAYGAFQGIVTGTGAVTATITINASNEDATGPGLMYPITFSNSSTTLNGRFNGFTGIQQYFPPVAIGAAVSGFGIPASTTVTAVTSTTLTINNSTTQAYSGAVLINNNNWVQLGVITLSGTNVASDGFTSISPWRWVEAVVSNLTGTGATAQVLLGV